MSEGKVRKWARDFKAGRDNIHADSRSSRSSVITDDMVASVEAKIFVNRRFTISTLSNDFPEVSSYNEEGDAMLNRIVTGDETWVSHVTPESKQQSMKWRQTHSPIRVKAKQTFPAQDHGVRVLG
ncbi:hypothetical protein AVEN_16736-1 [Araneus ventricosus]|uniref:Mos1 transposase HTH domain-containing protein n=1 Tax=Araneus ventricosus TaxID=182803 RepID=A0A4Y2GFK3_ARAVE|nr:hypothetical protein AVEN_16736-1 [Araneus ventricosus]